MIELAALNPGNFLVCAAKHCTRRPTHAVAKDGMWAGWCACDDPLHAAWVSTACERSQPADGGTPIGDLSALLGRLAE